MDSRVEGGVINKAGLQLGAEVTGWFVEFELPVGCKGSYVKSKGVDGQMDTCFNRTGTGY